MRLGRRPIIALLASLTLVALTLTSCDSDPGGGSGGDDNRAPTAAIDAPSAVAVGQQLTFDASNSSDPDGEISTFAWEFGDGAGGSGETVTHTYDSAGDYTVTLTVTDEAGAADSDNTEIAATELGPDSLMVTYQTEAAATGDPLASDYTLDGTPQPELAGTAAGSFVLEAGSGTRELCTTNTVYFQPACATFPTGNGNQTLQLVVDRKQVDVSVSATPASATVQVIDPATDSLEAEATGNLQALLAKRSGERKLVAFKPGYARDSVLVAADQDVSESFALSALPACSNGLDDDGDGLVDVWMDLDGNGIPTEGDRPTDPGCTGPADDNEAHVVQVLTFTGGADSTVLVSSDPSNWTVDVVQYDFDNSIRHAVGNIFVSPDAKISNDQNNEAFAYSASCGSTNSISDIVEDDPSVDGWYEPVVTGVQPSWFDTSTNCDQALVHKAFVNNNPGDGNDDVVYQNKPDYIFNMVIAWVYQPDTVSQASPDGSGSAAVSKINSGARSGSGTNGDSDVSVRRSGYVNSSTADR